MIKLKNILNEIINEAPVDNLSLIGFEKDKSGKVKPGSFTHDKRDVKIITHSRFDKIVRDFFKNTDYHFDLYFVNGRGLKKHSETGEVSKDFLTSKEGLNLNPKQIEKLNLDNDRINIFFVSNTGVDKQPFTPWTIAHRIGHAIVKKNSQFQQYVDHFEEIISSILKEYYGITMKSSYGYYGPPYSKMMAKVYNQLGTMGSTKNNQITRYYEFYYEVLAQYINTGGNVKLNKLPKKFRIGTGYYGRKIYAYFKGSEEEYRDMCNSIETLERDVNIYLIPSVLGSCLNKIYVM